MSSLSTEIGQKVRSIRDERGLTTTDLAFKVGISQAQISRLENGRQGFRTVTLEKIALALGVSMSEILSTDGIHTESELGQAMKSPEFRQAVEAAAARFMDGGQEEAIRSLK